MSTDHLPDLSPLGGYWDPNPITNHGGLIFPISVEYPRHVAVLPDPWPYRPEGCQAPPNHTRWILDGQILLCLGCGTDAT